MSYHGEGIKPLGTKLVILLSQWKGGSTEKLSNALWQDASDQSLISSRLSTLFGRTKNQIGEFFTYDRERARYQLDTDAIAYYDADDFDKSCKRLFDERADLSLENQAALCLKIFRIYQPFAADYSEDVFHEIRMEYAMRYQKVVERARTLFHRLSQVWRERLESYLIDSDGN